MGEKGNTWQNNLRFGLRTANSVYRHRESLFAVDESKTTLGKTWQITSRFTWEAPQTVAGMMAYDFYTTFGSIPGVEYHKGITFIKSKLMRSGLSLGNVAILNKNPSQFLYKHEFGHTIQSRYLGPLYLPVATLGSGISFAYDFITRGGGWNYYILNEAWATQLGNTRW